ncbi:hypothetical protein IC575_014226 [Cucumis melo]
MKPKNLRYYCIVLLLYVIHSDTLYLCIVNVLYSTSVVCVFNLCFEFHNGLYVEFVYLVYLVVCDAINYIVFRNCECKYFSERVVCYFMFTVYSIIYVDCIYMLSVFVVECI